ncbi:MAG TPA: DUF1211 domain-containing protein, partial [Bacteroidetes bacterium]|nr:DUF1211 domain-containing protein [Bacteroidota bacterium]
MKVSRVESLSDGIFAIAMTLMVLDLKLPAIADKGSITQNDLINMFFAGIDTLEKYAISFIVLGIYWI